MEYKCTLCGTVEETFEQPFNISIEYSGGNEFGYISVLRKNLCSHCMRRFLPEFEKLAAEIMPICDDPWRLYEENNRLKSRVFELEKDLKIINRKKI